MDAWCLTLKANMTDSTLWWVLTALAVATELLTGTFYLLMLAIGLAAGAVGAHLGIGMTGQLVCAALAGGGAVVALQKFRPTPTHQLSPQANADVNLDIGQTLHIQHWHPDLTAQASYRGAIWTVELMPDAAENPPATGLYRIREVVGSRLRVSPA
jgi:membrane protein implicated in regulation of membrane protease activity